jgi:hypothetical protein
MRQTGYVACMEGRGNEFIMSAGKSDGNKLFERPRSGHRSVGIVRTRTKGHGVCLLEEWTERYI